MSPWQRSRDTLWASSNHPGIGPFQTKPRRRCSRSSLSTPSAVPCSRLTRPKRSATADEPARCRSCPGPAPCVPSCLPSWFPSKGHVPGEPFPLLTASLTEAPLQPSAQTASGIAVLVAREAEDHLLTSHNLNY